MRGPSMSKNDKYVIEGMQKDGKSLDEMSEAIGRPKTTIARHLERIAKAEADAKKENEKAEVEKIQENKEEKKDSPVKKKTAGVKQKAPKKMPAHKLMTGKDKDGKSRGIIVMTQAAGERFDEATKNMTKSPVNRITKGGVFKIQEGTIE